ncbi:MAG TPA: hypothetical protein VNF68_10260 [Candidatus Baltobacteraceae bacterium]|nr:hypothetical protein [Candidatus Baltobacteraceae bacterium]
MLALVLSALLVQAAPSPSATPSAQPTATPVALYVINLPEGWQTMTPPPAQPAATELLSIALGPTIRGFRTKINVIRDVLLDPSETIEVRAKESAAYITAHNYGKIIVSRAGKVCNGGRDGWHFESSGIYNGRRVYFDQRVLLDGGYEYVATYTRPLGAPADPAAKRALDTLCPLPTQS